MRLFPVEVDPADRTQSNEVGKMSISTPPVPRSVVRQSSRPSILYPQLSSVVLRRPIGSPLFDRPLVSMTEPFSSVSNTLNSSTEFSQRWAVPMPKRPM